MDVDDGNVNDDHNDNVELLAAIPQLHPLLSVSRHRYNPYAHANYLNDNHNRNVPVMTVFVYDLNSDYKS